ncbi:MAG: hypothetical protein AB8I08_34400 [Sandaracinaceae bacterium]
MIARLSVCLLVVLALGCDPSPPTCVPGSTQICVGLGRCEGVQVCAEDGAQYEACVCEGGTVDGGLESDAGWPLDGSLSDAGPAADAATDAGTVGADAGTGACALGDPCSVADTSCFDAAHPIIEVLATAGVTGGIAAVPVVATVEPGVDLQAAIDGTSAGAIVLAEGTYEISETLRMRSGVVLRGADRDGVVLHSNIRTTARDFTVLFADGVEGAGLENLTLSHAVAGCEPLDDLSLDSPSYGDVFQADPCGREDLFAIAVEVDDEAHDNWVDGCAIRDSASHPVIVRGNHNTVRNSIISRTYNKRTGPGGAGYFALFGDRNLVVGNQVDRIRHFNISGGGWGTPATHNVVVENRFEVDVNFHDGDGGSNLVEDNTIHTPRWHGWPVVETGVPAYHLPPGPNNLVVNNDTNDRETGEALYGEPGVVYTPSDYGTVVDSGLSLPTCGTFYPLEGRR